MAINLEGFEEYRATPRRGIWQKSETPIATVSTSGLIGLNAAALKALGEPEAVIFLYDREAKLLALRAAAGTEMNAYRVIRQASGKSAQLHAKGVLRWAGIETTNRSFCEAVLMGGLLVFNPAGQSLATTG